MNDSLHEQAYRIFEEACDLPHGERTDFVVRACAGDSALYTEVVSLLRHDEAPADLNAALVDPARDAILSASRTGDSSEGEGPAVPERIGPYRVIRKIGEGGMGDVFEAEQESPRRSVALKVIRAGRLSPRLVRRLEHEAFVLGQLQHPGIAHIYQSGVARVDGRQQPYFAMELINGERITSHADRQGLSVRQRLELMARVCDAVQHAHQKGVIHRDLKPANILVVEHEAGTCGQATATPTTMDAIGQPKILDFGIARITDGDVQAATLQTDLGQLVGTLAYMSPEQVAGDSSRLDTRCDVYGLGIVAFQLLTGRLPLDVSGRPIAEAVCVIRDEEPASAGTFVRALRGDVDTIIAKALEKDPERRYASAAQLAADIRRYLGEEPIVARPASAMYNLRKFARRNKGLVGGLVTALAVLLLGAAGTGIGLAYALRANRQLARSNANLQVVAEFQSAQLSDLDVPLMGLQLRGQLLAAAGDEQRAQLEEQVSAINFVDLARKNLEQSFFGRALESIDARFHSQPLLQARLLQDLASTMVDLGLLETAVGPQQRALDIRRRELGDTHLDTLASIVGAGSLRERRGDFAGAEALYREALQAYQRVLGNDARETLSTLQHVGETLRKQGKQAEAESLARAALAGLRQQAGADNPATLGAMSSLATLLRDRGENEESERLYREVLARHRKQLGDEHPSTLYAVENLGNFLASGGRYEEATLLCREAFETRRRVLGDDHPQTLSSMTALAACLSRHGKYDEAERLQTAALAGSRRLLGDEHPDTMNAMDCLASVLCDEARFAEAEALFRESLAGRRRVLGNDHQATLRSIGNVGYVLMQQGKQAETEPYYRETLASFRRVYGNEHPHTLTAVGNLAVLLSGMGKDDEAEPLYLESLAGRRRILGDDHPSTLNAIYNMGDMYLRRGRLAEADPFCRQALDGYRRISGDDSFGTLYSLTLMGRLRMAQNRPADAEPCFQEAVERRRRSNGDDHPLTLAAADLLAESLEAQARWSDAEKWRRFLHAAAAEAESGDGAAVAERLAALGRNLLRQERFGEAEGALAQSVATYRGLESAEDWRRWTVQGLLAEAIAADPDRYAEAESMLLEAVERISRLPDVDGETGQRISAMRRRLASFCEAHGKRDEANSADR